METHDESKGFRGNLRGIVVLYKRPSVVTPHILIYMIGGCALTVQCVVHYCSKLWITTELQNCILRTVELCNDLRLLCSAREKRGKGYLPIRDRGWLRLGLRHLLKQLSRESRGDCM
jgi:hypothetical protein